MPRAKKSRTGSKTGIAGLPASIPDKRLLADIRKLWESSRLLAARSVNSALIIANWKIGERIVEAEQQGRPRAVYGQGTLKFLSERLIEVYGSGFSVSGLQYMRSFYNAYPGLLDIQHAVRADSKNGRGKAIQHAVRVESGFHEKWVPGALHPDLGWTHYRALIKAERRDARDFYEIEAIRNGWSGRQLERQIDSLLYFRLAKSRDKKGLLALANRGQLISKPVDVIKDPYVLEFLDLPESHQLAETKLEEALISKLQHFLLELGDGFAFIGRQKRITLEGDHFYPDLVFYHTRLKCYVVVDLKAGKLTHADLGQMQLYVNYHDREVAAKDDNPTLGLILCTDKNNAMVRFVLEERNRRIFTSRYKLHLPTEEELRRELTRELEEINGISAKPRPRKKKMMSTFLESGAR